nr:hypothetical protein [Campylobacter showae]
MLQPRQPIRARTRRQKGHKCGQKYLKKACDMEPELACDRYKEFIQR